MCSCTHTHVAQWLYIYLKQNGLGNASILRKLHSQWPQKKREDTNTVTVSEAHADIRALHSLVAGPYIG